MPFRRWLFNVTLALGVAVFLLPFPDRLRGEEQGCAPLEHFAPVVERFAVFRILQGDRRARAVAFFNAVPPESHFAWPSAYLAIRLDGWAFLLVGMEGTVCHFIRISPDGVFDLLERIDGVSV